MAEAVKGAEVTVNVVNLSLDSAPGLVDSITRLLEMVWNRNPNVAIFMIVCVCVWPFYALLMKYACGPREKAADSRVDEARRAYKQRQADAAMQADEKRPEVAQGGVE